MPKRFYTALAILLAAVMALSFLPIHGETEIYDTVVRLHVLANSDSEEDQALKLTVRDALACVADAKRHGTAVSAEDLAAMLDGLTK